MNRLFPVSVELTARDYYAFVRVNCAIYQAYKGPLGLSGPNTRHTKGHYAFITRRFKKKKKSNITNFGNSIPFILLGTPFRATFHLYQVDSAYMRKH